MLQGRTFQQPEESFRWHLNSLAARWLGGRGGGGALTWFLLQTLPSLTSSTALFEWGRCIPIKLTMLLKCILND